MTCNMREERFTKPTLLIIVATIGLCFWIGGVSWFMSKHISNQQSTYESQWQTYTYTSQTQRFSFEYPADWSVSTEEKFDEMPTLILASPDGIQITINPWHTKEFRGIPYAAMEERRVYGKNIVVIKTLYYKQKPIEIVAIFEDHTYPVQTITMEFPSGDVLKATDTFNHLLSSLSFK